jgi:outer membrane biosynthesis protein TonB
MERPVFKTFASAEGLKEWALWVFAMAMFVLRGQGLEPSPEAQQTAKSILQADCNDFKSLYREAALKYHPDKNNGNGSDTTADMALINDVYEQRKARGGCEKSNLRQTKTSEKPKKSKPEKPKKSKKSKPEKPKKPKKSKPEKPKKSKPKKPKTSEKRKKTRRKTKEANDDGISMGQVLAGVCLGAVVGSVAKECHKPRHSERSPPPSSPGRRTRRTYSSDSE